jgi:nucleoside-diphosphate-sugar epimerase
VRILITGAQGFVGRYVASAVLGSHPDAEVLGLGRSPRLDGCFSHHVTVRGMSVQARIPDTLFHRDLRYQYKQIALDDTSRLRTVTTWFQPDAVIHLASGLRGDEWPTLIHTNVAGTVSLIKAVGETCRRPAALVLGSTGGVYGPILPQDLPVTEEAPVNPADLYSATKVATEQIGRVLCAEYGMRYVAARLFNISGPGQSERHVCGRFASAIAEAATSPDSVLRVGCLRSTRDYIDVRDAASALVLLSESGTGTYNVASGIETATETVLNLLTRYAGLEGKLRVERIEGVPEGVPRHAGCVTRLRTHGYVPAFTLHESLRDVLDYYVEYGADKGLWPAAG